MKVTHLSTLDHLGGAFIAARRLHGALRNLENIDSELCIAQQHSGAPDTVALHNAFTYSLRRKLERLPLMLSNSNGISYESLAWLPNRKLARHIRATQPDVVHLQWTQNAFVPIGALKRFHAPIVWTFHDMWAFTGMYHHEHEMPPRCESTFEKRPEGLRGIDVDAWTWKRKRKAYENLNMCGVVPSRWMAEKAAKSTLWGKKRIEIIPNGIDSTIYKPINKAAARELFNLPPDGEILLFGAMFAHDDKNKGFAELMSALEALKEEKRENVHLAVFGLGECPPGAELPFPSTFFGVLHDEPSMAALYNAADVMVVPSRQESFGLTACEALACGTPVACFDTSGLKDIVEHEQVGYRAEAFDPRNLAHGIHWMLDSKERRSQLAANARAKVLREFDLDVVAQRHLELYQEISANK